MAKIALYNVKEGKVVDYELTADKNQELVATYDDSVIKFPGGIDKTELFKLRDAHNEANKNQVPVDLEAIAFKDELNQVLLDSLED